MVKWIVGFLVAAAAMAGIYAFAATTATSISATFNTAETASHARLKDFEDEVERISARYKTARAKCEYLSKTKKIECKTALRAEERRSARPAARL